MEEELLYGNREKEADGFERWRAYNEREWEITGEIESTEREVD